MNTAALRDCADPQQRMANPLAERRGRGGNLRQLLLAAAAMSLSACASLGMADLKPEAEVVTPMADVATQPDWAEYAPDLLPATDWVAAFRDTQLSGLVQEALTENTNIAVAAERLNAALAREGIAGAERLPSVTASGGLSRTERGNDLIGGNTNFNTGLNASWEPDLWGRISDNVNAAQLDSAASNADLAAARLSITGQVALLWFDLIEAGLLTDLSVRDVETQERALRLTQRRFEGGVTGSSDVRLARSSVAGAQALQALREQNRGIIARRLEILLSRYPAEALDARPDFPSLPPLEGAGSPQFALEQRPDLIAAEANLARQGLQVDIARKALLPRISLTGTADASAGSLKNFFDIDALVASLISNISAPIFQGGRLKGNVEQQKAFLRQQLASYEGTVLNAYLEVENALDAERLLASREAALRVALDEAQEAEDRLELRYTEGLASILQLLDAQSRRLNSEGQLIAARAERLTNRVRLHVALGGGDYGQLPALPVPL